MILTVVGFMILAKLVEGGILWEGAHSANDLIISRLSNCDKEGTKSIWYSDLKTKRISPVKTVSDGVIHINKTYQTVNVEIDISKLEKGKWKEHFFYLSLGDMCTEAVRSAPGFCRAIRAAGVPFCPFTEGDHPFRNFSGELDLKLPWIPFGSYRADMLYKKDKQLVGCLRILAQVNQRKKKN